MLLLNNINENNSLLNGPSTGQVLRHNTKALQEELYFLHGKNDCIVCGSCGSRLVTVDILCQFNSWLHMHLLYFLIQFRSVIFLKGCCGLHTWWPG